MQRYDDLSAEQNSAIHNCQAYAGGWPGTSEQLNNCPQACQKGSGPCGGVFRIFRRLGHPSHAVKRVTPSVSCIPSTNPVTMPKKQIDYSVYLVTGRELLPPGKVRRGHMNWLEGATLTSGLL